MSFVKNFLGSITNSKNNNSTGVNSTSSKLIQSLQTNDALTENGALTHSTSNNAIVDLFFIAGASRGIADSDLVIMLEKAWGVNQELTLRLIFWAGDVRGGAGERRFFRLALKWLETHYSEVLVKNIKAGNVEFFNRWDSLFDLVTNPEVKEVVLNQVEQGLENQDGLLAKWLPRKDQYNGFKKLLQQKMKINDAQYRKLVVHLSETVEQQMSSKNWSDITYDGVPSQAFNKYRQAFLRHDKNRFNQYISLALKGEVKVNAGAIFPHQLYQAYNQNKDEDSIVAQWNNLPNYLLESKERILPICDVSGSMMGLPMDVSVALGIYISERNSGIFQNAFITFSQEPKVQYLVGSLAQRIRQLETAEWGMNTDLYQVFRVLLNKAKSDNIEANEMPTMLLIFSDMEFDQAISGNTNLDSIKKEYANVGYELPRIVFWNLRGRLGNSPAKSSDQNIALVSGFSPAILQDLLQGNVKNFTPYQIMLQTLQKDRYSRVLI
ncbi:MAG: hypothetical protein OHK0017_08820 [Patescibacteria group bacterium]